LPGNKGNPPCPACGSSATLPFENEENERSQQTFSEIMLTALFIFLALFCAFIFLMLCHAGLPIGILIPLIGFLWWRRKRENRRTRRHPLDYVCLDCSGNFKA
jgi:Flp pilus assembly protein TadB